MRSLFLHSPSILKTMDMDLNKFTIEFFEGVYNTPSLLINEDNPPIQFEEEDPTLIDRMEDEEIFEIRSSGESAVVDYE